MSETIKFGIDLGTTNSIIAKYNQGSVEVFKNPIGHKETLPSVVAFRKERIIIGDKAKEFLEKDPSNVVGSFKRKMGTTESFFIMNLADTKTPVELSSLVLKELKNFVYTNEKIDSVVITIPASFDTIQSNATKKAGLAAGFEEVVLLQEPIAASLAYANKDEDSTQSEGQWLVYDLGGGTFDVALVKIADGEMRVVDHQGDNFLGGVDFDNLIIEKIVIPYLNSTGKFVDLEHELKSSNGKYNKLYYALLNKAEEVKVLLSAKESTDIEFTIEDRDGEEQEMYFSITRAQFEVCIKDKIDETLNVIKTIIARNSLTTNDIKYVLMIGGSTYIPYVRNSIKDKLGLEINCGIDPTTAVAVGAAYYAGSKPKSIVKTVTEESNQNRPVISSNLSIKTAYQKTSQDESEYFAARVEGDFMHMFYRITRTDGGFDTGLKALAGKISEDLPLVKNSSNFFQLKVYDSANNIVNVDVPEIEIIQGKFSVLGQPLPNDICIEVDDYENNMTKLEVVFEKNALLPLKKTITKKITRHIAKGSSESIIINVLEGSRYSAPSSNLPIGSIEINGQSFERDIIKNADIEITLHMSESRDLKITTYLSMVDHEVSNLFNPSERHVNINKLKAELSELVAFANTEISDAESREEYELAGKLKAVKSEIENVWSDANDLSSDDVTDNKYQYEDKKRKLSTELDALTRNRHLSVLLKDYYEWRDAVNFLASEHANDSEKATLKQINDSEPHLIASSSTIALKDVTKKMRHMYHRIAWRVPERLVGTFKYYAVMLYDAYPDKRKADKIIADGENAIGRKSYEELRFSIGQLDAMLPEDKKADLNGTGIG